MYVTGGSALKKTQILSSGGYCYFGDKYRQVNLWLPYNMVIARKCSVLWKNGWVYQKELQMDHRGY